MCYKRDRPINRVFCRELHLALMFPGRLQKDLFKGKWSLAKSYFKQNYKLRRLLSSPVPLRELVRPSLACEQTFLLPQKKIDFFLRERGRLYTGWVVPHFFFLFSVECVSWRWVGGSDCKKKPKIKNHKTFRNKRPWYPRMTLKVYIHIFGLAKCTIHCKKCACFSLCCYYAHFSD